MVDINYPATIIWGQNYTNIYNGTTWATASGYPWYLDNFYDKLSSSTYEEYARASYISNV